MNNAFEQIGQRLPYELSEMQEAALRERIRVGTTSRDKPLGSPHFLRRVGLVTAAAAVVGIAVAAFFAVYEGQPTVPAADLEQLLRTASDATLQQAAQTNYDDLLVNQQL